MIDTSGLKLNRAISPEIIYVHLMAEIQEAELIFSLMSLKGETFHVLEGQSKISGKR